MQEILFHNIIIIFLTNNTNKHQFRYIFNAWLKEQLSNLSGIPLRVEHVPHNLNW